MSIPIKSYNSYLIQDNYNEDYVHFKIIKCSLYKFNVFIHVKDINGNYAILLCDKEKFENFPIFTDNCYLISYNEHYKFLDLCFWSNLGLLIPNHHYKPINKLINEELKNKDSLVESIKELRTYVSEICNMNYNSKQELDVLGLKKALEIIKVRKTELALDI